MAPLHIDILAYREWALDLAQNVKFFCYDRGYECHIITPHINGYHKEADITFLVGWSEIVPLEFYGDRMVLVLHPSPLPKYRGGSPIQNQIIAGETESKVTLFKLDKDHPEIDSGPIHSQAPYSLMGNLQRILEEISYVGKFIVQDAIKEFSNTGTLLLCKQDESKATTFKRRRPEDSQITPVELIGSTAKEMYNKIRALQDPYPNAFIVDKNGDKLYITGAHLG